MPLKLCPHVGKLSQLQFLPLHKCQLEKRCGDKCGASVTSNRRGLCQGNSVMNQLFSPLVQCHNLDLRFCLLCAQVSRSCLSLASANLITLSVYRDWIALQRVLVSLATKHSTYKLQL